MTSTIEGTRPEMIVTGSGGQMDVVLAPQKGKDFVAPFEQEPRLQPLGHCPTGYNYIIHDSLIGMAH